MKRLLLVLIVLVGAGTFARANIFPFPSGSILLPGQSADAGSISLGTLYLSSTTFTTGQSMGTVLATIIGNTSGSSIAIESSDTSGLFSVSGTNLLAGSNFAAASAGGYNSGLTETLAAAINSPNTSPISVTLNGGSGCSNSLNLMQACNSQYLAAGVIF